MGRECFDSHQAIVKRLASSSGILGFTDKALLKRERKFSAVERRNYEKSWRTQPNNRDLLMKELEHKMGN